jgi:hypothetical protein
MMNPFVTLAFVGWMPLAAIQMILVTPFLMDFALDVM